MTAGGVRKTAIVDGHVMSYWESGPVSGPPVVLIHGLASDSQTWDQAAGPLAAHGLRVIAVDLLGHGQSDKPAGGYLLEDFGRQLLGLFAAIGLSAATLCGHSLGGAIAVQFAYHHPERVSRLVLVSAGGLGREVHLALRAGALPIAPRVLGWLLHPRLRSVYASPRLHRLLRLTPDNVTNLRRAGRALAEQDGRAAFFASLRGVIEPSGQKGSFLEMRYLSDRVPTLLVWSEKDGVIPVAHARATRAYLPGSQLLVFAGGGHEPHRRHAVEFAQAVAEFVESSA